MFCCTDASKSSPNGKKCFTCEGETCTKTLNCEGTEDHCIKTTCKWLASSSEQQIIPLLRGMLSDSNIKHRSLLDNIVFILSVNVGGRKMTVKGCASEMICSASSAAQMTGAIGAELSCCQGDFCNSASSTSAGLMLMAVPLFSLVFFF